MKKLKFAPNLVEMVLNGTKTSTWRLFDDKALCVDDELEFINSDTGEVFVNAKIISVTEKPLRDINAADFIGHEPFDTKEEMLATYRSYYGEEVNWDTTVKMVNFNLLNTF